MLVRVQAGQRETVADTPTTVIPYEVFKVRKSSDLYVPILPKKKTNVNLN